MIRSIILALTLVGTGILAPPASANDPVVLRESVMISGDTVTLADLFSVDGEAGDVVVSRAPEPGQRSSLDPDYVQTVAARNGLSWANASRLRRIAVQRDSRPIGADMLRDLIEGELYAREGRSFDMRLNGASTLHTPSDATGLPRIVSFDHDIRSGLFSADIITHDGGETIRISGRAHATTEIPVLGRAVAAGEVLSDADIDWLAVRSDRIRNDAILDVTAVVGQETRRALRPGEPLRAYDLREPVVIARGDIVNLVFTAPGITLNARARALEDAGADQIIRFVNLQSNRTVEAMVEGPGRARVVAAGGPS